MSSQAIAPARPVTTTTLFGTLEQRHRLRVWLGFIATAATTVVLTVYGFGYYSLDAARRPLSPKHLLLRSSGTVGLRLGLFGMALFLLIFLYPVRKRWRWLSKQGKTRHWLDLHIVMGIAAPVIITFHAAFKMHGIAGIAYWLMVIVSVSGFVGRYLYAQIPRRLDAAEMTLQEMQEASAQLAAELLARGLEESELASLLGPPRLRKVKDLPLALAVWYMVYLDLRRPFILWRIRRQARARLGASFEFGSATELLRRQAALSKKILFLSRTKQVFHLWHVVHRPFSYSFAVLVVLHVGVVLMLGF